MASDTAADAPGSRGAGEPGEFLFDMPAIITVKITTSGGEEAARSAAEALHSMPVRSRPGEPEIAGETFPGTVYDPVRIAPRLPAYLVSAVDQRGTSIAPAGEEFAEPVSGEARPQLTRLLDGYRAAAGHPGEQAAAAAQLAEAVAAALSLPPAETAGNTEDPARQRLTAVDLADATAFFLDNGPYPNVPGSEEDQGSRQRYAAGLAAAEAAARTRGWRALWSAGPDPGPGPAAQGDSAPRWRARLLDDGGTELGTLEGIDLGRDSAGTPNRPGGAAAARVAAARLARSALEGMPGGTLQWRPGLAGGYASHWHASADTGGLAVRVYVTDDTDGCQCPECQLAPAPLHPTASVGAVVSLAGVEIAMTGVGGTGVTEWAGEYPGQWVAETAEWQIRDAVREARDTIGRLADASRRLPRPGAGADEYLVTWDIDVTADSHDAAAREARRAQSRPGSWATVYDVTHQVTGETQRIDLPTRGTPRDGPRTRPRLAPRGGRPAPR